VILSETPETYGAEHLLTAARGQPRGRRKTGGADALVGRIHRARGRGDNATPVPAQGRRAHHDPGKVARRDGQGPAAPTWSTSCNTAEEITKKGFVFMTPGLRPGGGDGQVAGRRQPGRFTTGRGSRVRLQPAPSNQACDQSAMFKRMEDDMDVNCGTILDGEETGAGMRPAHFRADAEDGVGPADQERKF